MSLDVFFSALSEATNEVERRRAAGYYEPSAEEQRRYRIRLSLAAYAYEFHDDPIMTDADFDDLSGRVDTNIKTGDEEMDAFFEKKFDPSTGQWIHDHPGLDRLAWIYNRYFKGR